MSGSWREFRPAIWLAMAGIALALMLSPSYFGAILIGASIGAAARVQLRRRRRS